MTRRQALFAMAATLARAAGRLPANRNLKWGVATNLWKSIPDVRFTDILDVMKDTGFIGVRLTPYPEMLKTYDLTAAQMQKELSKRGCHVITVSFNGAMHEPARRAEVVADARNAMKFLQDFGAEHLMVFSPNRKFASEAAFRATCETFNEIGRAAREMNFYAALHHHLGQIVQNPDEIDRCMALTDPKLLFLAPDTAHLHLVGCDVVKTFEKYKDRIVLADYKDAKRLPGTKPDTFDHESIFDLGDGEIDFPGCHRVLKSRRFRGWLTVDLDIARNEPRASFERCGAYVVNKLEPIYL
jgi:inosose dehydratase